jgi:hypothetical protein
LGQARLSHARQEARVGVHHADGRPRRWEQPQESTQHVRTNGVRGERDQRLGVRSCRASCSATRRADRAKPAGTTCSKCSRPRADSGKSPARRTLRCAAESERNEHRTEHASRYNMARFRQRRPAESRAIHSRGNDGRRERW